jgi:hypothetical protein
MYSSVFFDFHPLLVIPDIQLEIICPEIFLVREYFSKKRCVNELWKDSSHNNDGALQIRMDHVTIIIGPRLIERPAPALTWRKEL